MTYKGFETDVISKEKRFELFILIIFRDGNSFQIFIVFDEHNFVILSNDRRDVEKFSRAMFP